MATPGPPRQTTPQRRRYELDENDPWRVWAETLPDGVRQDAAVEAMTDASIHPDVWADALHRGWGGVKSRRSHMARAIAPLLDKMLEHEGGGALPGGCIYFSHAMTNVKRARCEYRARMARKRLEEEADNMLVQQRDAVLTILDNCGACVVEIDRKRVDRRACIEEADLQACNLDESSERVSRLLTAQAGYLLRKHTGIELPISDLIRCGDGRRHGGGGGNETCSSTITTTIDTQDDNEDIQGSRKGRPLFGPDDLPLSSSASAINRAARRAGIQTRGSFDTIAEYVKDMIEGGRSNQRQSTSGTDDDALIDDDEEDLNPVSKENRRIAAVKAPRSHVDPYPSLWAAVRRVARTPHIPVSLRQVLMQADDDDDDDDDVVEGDSASRSWWGKFQRFWQEQSRLHIDTRDHRRAETLMDDWNAFGVEEVLQLEEAVLPPADKRPPGVSDVIAAVGQYHGGDGDGAMSRMSALFEATYRDAGDDLTAEELDMLLKKVDQQLEHYASWDGECSLDAGTRCFIRQYMGLSNVAEERALPVRPAFHTLPEMDLRFDDDDDGGDDDHDDDDDDDGGGDDDGAGCVPLPPLPFPDTTTTTTSSSMDVEMTVADPPPPPVAPQQQQQQQQVLEKETQEDVVMSASGPLAVSDASVVVMDPPTPTPPTATASGTAEEEEEEELMDPLDRDIAALQDRKLLSKADTTATRLFLRHTERLVNLRGPSAGGGESGAESPETRHCKWGLGRCWALINFLCSPGNADYQASVARRKQMTTIASATTSNAPPRLSQRYEAMRTLLYHHFRSSETRNVLASVGTGKEDEAIYSNSIHVGSWVADFPLVTLQEAKSMVPGHAMLGGGGSPGSLGDDGARAIEIEPAWDYTMGGWLCLRCKQKLRERYGDCECKCFRGHARRECMGPASPCYGFHPNRLMEKLALGLPTRYITDRGDSDAYFKRSWSPRQRHRRFRMAIKNIVLHGDPFFGVVPPSERHISYTGLVHSMLPIMQDWLQRMDWERYDVWDHKRSLHHIYVMNVARLDILVEAGAWAPHLHEQQQQQLDQQQQKTDESTSSSAILPKKKKARGRKRRSTATAGRRPRAVWSRISGRCAMCGQDMVVNKNNTSRGLCVGCRSWKRMTEVESPLIGNIPEYRRFNAKASSVADKDADLMRQSFGSRSQYTEVPLPPTSPFAFSPNGLGDEVTSRFRKGLRELRYSCVRAELDDCKAREAIEDRLSATLPDFGGGGEDEKAAIKQYLKEHPELVGTIDCTGCIWSVAFPDFGEEGNTIEEYLEERPQLLETIHSLDRPLEWCDAQELQRMERVIWEQVRSQICCWSQAAFERLLLLPMTESSDGDSWDPESKRMVAEWRRVWRGAIDTCRDPVSAEAFRQTIVEALTTPAIAESEERLLDALPAAVVPADEPSPTTTNQRDRLALFGDLAPVLFPRRGNNNNNNNTSSESPVARLVRWWPQPIVRMVNRWLSWDETYRIFLQVRERFLQTTPSALHHHHHHHHHHEPESEPELESQGGGGGEEEEEAPGSPPRSDPDLPISAVAAALSDSTRRRRPCKPPLRAWGASVAWHAAGTKHRRPKKTEKDKKKKRKRVPKKKQPAVPRRISTVAWGAAVQWFAAAAPPAAPAAPTEDDHHHHHHHHHHHRRRRPKKRARV